MSSKIDREKLKEFAFRIEKTKSAKRAEAVDAALEIAPGVNRLYIESRKLLRGTKNNLDRAISYINRGKSICSEASKGFTRSQEEAFYKTLEVYARNHGNLEYASDMVGTFRDSQNVLTSREEVTAAYLAKPEKYGKALENRVSPDTLGESAGEEAAEFFEAFAS